MIVFTSSVVLDITWVTITLSDKHHKREIFEQLDAEGQGIL